MAGTVGAAQLWSIGLACPRPQVTSSAPQKEVGGTNSTQANRKHTRKMEDQADHLSMKMRISIFPDLKDIET